MIQLISPKNGEILDQLTAEQMECLNNTGRKIGEDFDWLNLKRKGMDLSIPQPFVFTWETEGSAVLLISPYGDFSEYQSFVGNNRAEVYNLFIGKKYYWMVVKDGEASEIRCFKVNPRAPRLIKADGVSNVRDIGGRYNIHGWKIKQGMVYRGTEMDDHHTIAPEGIRVLKEDLGIRMDFDLRASAVGKIKQSPLGEDVKLEIIPAASYDEFIDDKETTRKLFKQFLNKDNYPMYVHCWGGADRTGTLILLLCGILGLDNRALFEEYEFTTMSIWGVRSIHSEWFKKFLNAIIKYKGNSLAEKSYNYLVSCGITPEEIREIREILLEEV